MAWRVPRCALFADYCRQHEDAAIHCARIARALSFSLLIAMLLWCCLLPDAAHAGWERQTSGITSEIDAIVFKSDSMGWLISADQILNSTDGGHDWGVQLRDTIGSFVDLDFENLDTGLAVGGYNAIGQGTFEYLAWTSDGGSSWIPVMNSFSQYWYYTACRLLGPKATWIAGFETDMIDFHGHVDPYFQPGGPELGSSSTRFDDVDAVDSLHAWALAYYGWGAGDPVAVWRINALTDNWECACDSFPRALGECRFDFVSPARGWMACQGGHILATIDSGFSWIDQYVNTMLPLNAVSFADSLSGWVVGDSGVVLRTRDGGAHWQVEPSGTGSDLYTVCFRDTMNGWAAGSDGAIIHYAPSAGVEEYRAPKWTSSVLAVHPDRTVFRGVLRFRVSGPPEVDLKVRNSAGQTVWNRRISGNCEFQWDGRDKNGRDLPPGVYFLVARDQSACATARVTLVR